jgi:glycosyltransferase involved in cell wall biosynthesis
VKNSPFFSVIIPTKNRSHLVGFAIQSLLEQTFEDFEVVVIDNDDSDTLTRDVVASFSDSRLKYYRTGDLSMPDNWEYGLSKTSGRYITVLEDKQAFYPNALEVIHKIALGGAEAITWCFDVLDDREARPRLLKYFGENTVSKQSSDEILRTVVKDIGSIAYNKLPRMIHSCVHCEAIDFVREKTSLGRFFIDVNPDYCAAFIQLNYIDEVAHIDSSLTVLGATSIGTGALNLKKGVSKERLEKDLGDIIKFTSHVPIKSPSILKNIILNDYLRLGEILGGRLRNFEMSPRSYIIMCYRDIIRMRLSGGDVKEESRLLREYIRTQPPLVRKGLWLLFAKIAAKAYIWKYVIEQPGIYSIARKLLRLKIKRFTGFNNVLEVTRDGRFHPEVRMGAKASTGAGKG